MQDRGTLIKELDAKSYEELVAVHRQFEQRLEQLNRKSWLTPEEELEEKEIKKLKLLVKDRIARIASTAGS